MSNAVNQLSLAVKLLSQYYSGLGRFDLVSIINESALGDAAAANVLKAAGGLRRSAFRKASNNISGYYIEFIIPFTRHIRRCLLYKRSSYTD